MENLYANTGRKGLKTNITKGLSLRAGSRGFSSASREFKQRFFNRRTSTGSRLFTPLSRHFEQILGQIVSLRVKTLSHTNLVASRHMKREKKKLTSG